MAKLQLLCPEEGTLLEPVHCHSNWHKWNLQGVTPKVRIKYEKNAGNLQDTKWKKQRKGRSLKTEEKNLLNSTDIRRKYVLSMLKNGTSGRKGLEKKYSEKCRHKLDEKCIQRKRLKIINTQSHIENLHPNIVSCITLLCIKNRCLSA